MELKGYAGGYIARAKMLTERTVDFEFNWDFHVHQCRLPALVRYIRPASSIRANRRTVGTMRCIDSVRAARVAWCLVLAAAFAGCQAGPQSGPSCGPVPLNVGLQLLLAYPAPGATNVPTTIGQIVFLNGFAGLSTIQLNSSSSGSVPVGPLSPAPSPLPSPLAPPPPNPFTGGPYFAGSVPTLAPATAYTVVYSFTDRESSPPCIRPGTAILGTFTTQ